MAFCTKCGATLPQAGAFCGQCGNAASIPDALPADAPDGSLRASLARLGIPLGLRQIIGLGISLILGVALPRLAPYVLPIVFPLLDKLPWAHLPFTIETFNTWSITLLTLAVTFVPTFIAFRQKA